MFNGYPRSNGSAGVRNQVGVISLMDNCNGVARKIAENVRGTELITDLFGRKMIGLNHEMRLKAIHGMANACAEAPCSVTRITPPRFGFIAMP